MFFGIQELTVISYYFQAFKQEGEDEAAAAEDKAKKEAREADKAAALAERAKKLSLSEEGAEKVRRNKFGIANCTWFKKKKKSKEKKKKKE